MVEEWKGEEAPRPPSTSAHSDRRSAVEVTVSTHRTVTSASATRGSRCGATRKCVKASHLSSNDLVIAYHHTKLYYHLNWVRGEKFNLDLSRD